MAINDDTTNEWLLHLQKAFIILFVILISSNGIIVCSIFTLNKRVLNLYKASWSERKASRQNRDPGRGHGLLARNITMQMQQQQQQQQPPQRWRFFRSKRNRKISTESNWTIKTIDTQATLLEI